jgi:hypothetical protein
MLAAQEAFFSNLGFDPQSEQDILSHGSFEGFFDPEVASMNPETMDFSGFFPQFGDSNNAAAPYMPSHSQMSMLHQPSVSENAVSVPSKIAAAQTMPAPNTSNQSNTANIHPHSGQSNPSNINSMPHASQCTTSVSDPTPPVSHWQTAPNPPINKAMNLSASKLYKASFSNGLIVTPDQANKAPHETDCCAQTPISVVSIGSSSSSLCAQRVGEFQHHQGNKTFLGANVNSEIDA